MINTVVRTVVAASASSLPVGADDFTLTSRQSSTLTRHQQVPVPAGSGVRDSHSEQAAEAAWAAGGGRYRRSQSSTAVFRAAENGSTPGRQRLGSTYDEGDYDPVDSVRPGVVASTPTSLRRHQTVASSSSTSYTPPVSVPVTTM